VKWTEANHVLSSSLELQIVPDQANQIGALPDLINNFFRYALRHFQPPRQIQKPHLETGDEVSPNHS
jgi:hypothetical protein